LDLDVRIVAVVLRLIVHYIDAISLGFFKYERSNSPKILNATVDRRRSVSERSPREDLLSNESFEGTLATLSKMTVATDTADSKHHSTLLTFHVNKYAPASPIPLISTEAPSSKKYFCEGVDNPQRSACCRLEVIGISFFEKRICDI
jgi:hypothetical protein